MTIAYVGTSTGSGNGGSITLADPGVAGAFLLAVAESDNVGETFGAPDASWITIFGPSTLTSDSAVYQVWYKASAVGSGTYAFSNTHDLWGLTISAWSGVDQTTPLQVTPVRETHDDSRASPANVIAPTLTTTADGCMILWVGVNDLTVNSGSASFTPPSGYTSRVAFRDASGWNYVEVAELSQASAGVVPAATGVTTLAGATMGVVGMHIALALAGGSPPAKSTASLPATADAVFFGMAF